MADQTFHHLVPEFILDHYTAGDFRGAFPAAGLFVDISGFSSITDRLMVYGQHGAEVLAEIIRSVFDPLISRVYQQGGFVATIAGDAFTALFPVMDGEAAACAHTLAAAWGIQRYMLDHPVYPTQYQEFQVSAKVGLAYGEAGWGIITSKDRRRAAYYFRGTAVDGCAKAEHLAQAGEIIAEAGFTERVKEKVEVAPFDEHFRILQVLGDLPAPRQVIMPLGALADTAPFFPVSLLTQSYTGEFRQVANLFISLPTIRTETQLTIFMESLFALQEKYRGLLHQLDFGDKGSNLYLFWGAPVAYENDIERAVNFILDLQTVTSIPINAGLTYSISHVGFIGSSLREDYTSFGRGVNLAARFMTAAPQGEIWLDEAITQSIQSKYDVEYIGEKEFKGFAQPQKVYVLLERRETGGAFFQGQLIGREAELSQMAEFVQLILNGKYPGILAIYGEPGIGKSRLAYAFMNSSLAQENPLTWAVCQADQILRQSLNPFRYFLRHYFGISLNQGEARNKRSFNLKLSELISATQDAPLADELDRTRSFLGALVDLHWPDSLYEQLDAQGRYENAFSGLVTLLKAESRRNPMVLLIEDLQWLDSDSMAFLLNLHRLLAAEASAGAAFPIAILATARIQEIDPQWAGELSGQRIDMSGLPPDDLARLAEDLLGGPLSRALRTLLNERSEGNPFFAEQILRYLQTEKLLQPSPEGWQCTASEQPPLPDDLQAVLVARLDRLERKIKEVVQTAAVLGREFEIRLLAQMLQDNRLPEKVMRAEEEGVWSALSEIRYIFRHALLRDAAYRMQAYSRLKRLHALAMQAFESLYAEDLLPHYGEIAYHAEQAGLVDQARRYLKLAGDNASSAYQNEQGIDYYSRALNLWPLDDRIGQFDLLMAREKLYNWLANRAAQKQDLDRLSGLLDEMDEQQISVQEKQAIQAKLLIRLANYYETIGDLQQCTRVGRQAVELSRTAGDRETEGEAYLQWGVGLWRMAHFSKALHPLERALEVARETGNITMEANSLRNLGVVHQNLLNHEQARQYFSEALKIFRQTGNLAGQARALNSLGALLSEQCEFQKSLNYFEDTWRLRRTIGDRRGEMIAINNMGLMNVLLGRYKQARDSLEQVLAFYEATGDRASFGETSQSLGALALYCGNFSEAEQILNRSLAAAYETGDRMTEALADSMLGLVSHNLGKVAGAMQHIDRALAVMQEMGYIREKAFALNYKGFILLDLGQIEDADAAFREALAAWDQTAERNTRIEAVAGLAKTSILLGRAEIARRAVEEILAHLGTDIITPDWAASETYLVPLQGMDTPFQALLETYEVLQNLQDPRADIFLKHANQLLQLAAERIGSDAMRQSFLENIPFHKKMAKYYFGVV
jgi:predicted ATPase/class 3 adenylate cyclase